MTPPPTSPRSRSRWAAKLALPAIATAFALGGGCGDLREDELKCEEAVAHLMGCCPRFEPSVSCEYKEQECAESIPTDIAIDQSECIRDLSCEDVRRRGLCDADTWQSALSGVCS